MADDRPTTYNILFVCTGNTCRSPLAEVMARHELASRGWSHVKVESAGTSATWGAPASEGSLDSALEIDLDLSGHRSQPLTFKLVSEADIIIAMTISHMMAVETQGGEGKAGLLSDFIEGSEEGSPIADPIGGSTEIYRATRDEIARGVQGLLARLESILAP